MKFTLVAILLAMMFFESSCENGPMSFSTVTKYPNGKTKTESQKINGRQYYFEYYQDGTMKTLSIGDENEKESCFIEFYSSSGIKSVTQNKDQKEGRDFVEFDKHGHIYAFVRYKNGVPVFHVVYDSLGNVTDSSPFLTVNAAADTITLGESFSAEIFVNHPQKGFDCKVYYEDSLSTVDDRQFSLLGEGTHHNFHVNPRPVGKHSYVIALIQTKMHPTIKDSVSLWRDTKYEGSYFVKAK